MPDGALKLELVNVFGNYLNEKVDIVLRRNLNSADVRRVSGLLAVGPVDIEGLADQPNNLYQVEIFAPSYFPVQMFMRADYRAVRTVTLAVNPSKVKRVEFPDFRKIPAGWQAILNSYRRSSGEEVYATISDMQRACLLNILAKCTRTRLACGRNVLSYLDMELLDIRQDRIFFRVPEELREETEHSVEEFRKAKSTLHKPLEGFVNVGSWKTPDIYGNLQLTFSANSTEMVADIDIDDAAGLKHLFQVARNAVKGPTHPYHIHQILVRHQEIDPGYRLIVGA